MSGPIVAMGGAEFSMRPENEALHDYVLSHAETDSAPRICLLPTASGDPNDQIISFHAAMERRGCIASAISLFRLGVTPIDFAEHLLAQDVIYVTGGSMVNLLALWREHKIDTIMRAAHEQGIVLCGYSAGSMCWFEQGVSRGSGAPAPVDGLGLVAREPLRPLLRRPGAARRLPEGGRRRDDQGRPRARRPRRGADSGRSGPGRRRSARGRPHARSGCTPSLPRTAGSLRTRSRPGCCPHLMPPTRSSGSTRCASCG